MDASPSTTVAAPSPPPMTRALTTRQEAYARGVAAGLSYSEAFRQGGLKASSAGSMSRQIGELNRTPGIRARVASLRERADDSSAVSTVAERMAWLKLIIQADPEELSRVVSDPCDLCWTDEALAKAYAAYFSPSPFQTEPDALPDPKKPRHGCQRCRGEGIKRVVITPTDDLSPAGRALFKGAYQDKDGVIKIETHDQQAANDMLNKMQSAYVQRSLNLNANISVTAARDASPADALRLFDQFNGQ